MTVATPVQPDATTDEASTYKARIDACIAAGFRTALAFAPHEQSSPDMTVRLDAGVLWNGSALAEVAAQSSASISAPSAGNDRIDRVVIDASTGTVSVITGTEDPSPSAPALTAGKIPICQVLLDEADTEITNDMITDERPTWFGNVGTSVLTGGNVLAPHENLVITRPTAATIDIDADAVLLKDSGGAFYRAESVDLTVDITASGANGLDTGSEATSTWYYLWAIYNGTTVAGLISTSKTAPTMPSGYTYKGIVGAFYNDGSSDILNFQQNGIECTLDIVIQDYATAFTTTAATPTLTAPPNTIAKITVLLSDNATRRALVTETSQTDAAPLSTRYHIICSAGASLMAVEMTRRVNASSQVRVRSDAAVTTSEINTIGWRFE